MKTTKYEDIIFLERDIENLKRSLETWQAYINGERDIYTENAHILSRQEEIISELGKETSNLPDDPMNWDYWICDIYCDNDFSSRDDFMTNYKEILRKIAKYDFYKKIEWFSPANAKLQYLDIQSEIENLNTQLEKMMKKLKPSEVINLDHVRESPDERINCSASFLCEHTGSLVAKGLKKGLETSREY